MSTLLSCTAGTPKRTPHRSRAAQSAVSRGDNLRRCSQPLPKFMVTMRKAFPGRRESCASRAQPAPPGASVLRAGATTCAPPEPVHSANRSLVYTRPPDAVPSPKEPQRAAGTQTRAAPFTSGADHQKPKRSVREVCSLRLSATSPPVEL
jgi:hypothetical protein